MSDNTPNASEKDKSATKPGRLGRGLGSLLGNDLGGNTPNLASNFLGGGDSLPKSTVSLTKEPAPTKAVIISTPGKNNETIDPQTALKAATATSSVVSAPSAVSDENRIWKVAIDKISANTYQPRQMFNKEKIQELANSIKEQGILQPIVARKTSDGKYEIIAGERRWRAAQLAGLHEVPIILRTADDRKSLELALIENIQRENLNPIEEAEAFEQLMKDFNLSHQEVSDKVGKDRTTITNTLRLLTLVPEVKRMLSEGLISAGHAKALLAITDPIKQKEIAKKIASERLTVRAAEKLVKAVGPKENTGGKLDFDVTEGLVKGLADDLQKALATKVQIDYSNQKGKISIYFYSDDELTELSERLKQTWKKSESPKI